MARPRPRGAVRTLVAVLVGVTMITGIISSLGAPLIPSVAVSLHVSLASAQWSLTVALLTACVAAPIMGRLGDGPRRRATLLGGLAVVTAGGIVAGLASSLGVLVAGRAMQGVGLGLAPVTMAAARDHLPADRSPGVIGILSVCGAAGVGAGYPVSGLIAADLGLHAAFFFGAGIAALALIAAAVVIPGSSKPAAGPLDGRGAVVLAVGLVALLLGISEGQPWGWTSARIIGLFVVAVVVLAGWARVQLGTAVPLVDLRLLGRRAVLTADLAATVLGIAMYMFVTLVTEFVQEPHTTGYGLSASSLVAGLCLVPFSIASLAVSRTIPAMRRSLGIEAILVVGSLLVAAGGAFFALLHAQLWEAFAAMAVIGIGFGYTFAAIPGMIAAAVPADETGSAMGLYQVTRYIGFSLGSALAASVLASDTVHGGTDVLEHGYVDALWLGTAICVAAAVLSWLLSRRTPAAPALGTLDETARDRLAAEEAELASAGLAGGEFER
jgi:MFS family permease